MTKTPKETKEPEIVQRESPVLRLKAISVDPNQIGSSALNTIIDNMRTALSSQKDGIAIAAPQIGVSLKIFVVSGALLAMADKNYSGPKTDLIFINPEITRRSKDKMEVEEGCLSVRWLYGKLKRSSRVTLKAINEKGDSIERGASGLLAQIFQHEVDHLEGVLFTDKAKEVWEMTDEEIAELKKK